jgi:hypothetical protein
VTIGYHPRSGATAIAAGEALTFKLDLLVTPFRSPDVREHFRQRTLQVGYPVAAVGSSGMPGYDWCRRGPSVIIALQFSFI